MLSKKTSPGIRRALAVLRIVARQNEPVAFSTLREMLGGIEATQLTRILKVMLEEGTIERTVDRRYRAGTALLLAFGARFRNGGRAKLIQPLLDELAKETGQTTAYVEPVDDGYTFIAKCEMPDSYHHLPIGQTGQTFFNNGFGVVCLAHQPESFREYILSGQEKEIASASQCDHDYILKHDFFISKDKGYRFLAPVFLLPEKKFLGVLGVSLIRFDLSAKEKAHFEKLIRAAAQKASTLFSEQ